MKQVSVATRVTHGYAAVITAAVLWGIGGVVVKMLLAGGVSPQVLVAVRMGGAAAIMWIVLAFRPQLLRVSGAQLRALISIGFLMAAGNYAQMLTIELTNVTVGVFSQFLGLSLLLLHARFSAGRPITPVRLTSMTLTLAGGYFLLTSNYRLAFGLRGMAAGLLNAVVYAVYVVLGDRQARWLSPWTMMTYAMTAGALIWSLWVPPWVAFGHHYSEDQWGLLAFITILASIAPFVLYFLSLKYIEAFQASLTNSLKPVVAAVGAYFLVGERLELMQMMGAVMVLAGVLLLQLSAAERQWAGQKAQAMAPSASGASGASGA